MGKFVLDDKLDYVRFANVKHALPVVWKNVFFLKKNVFLWSEKTFSEKTFLMFFRQLLTLNYVKLTTGWEPTSFLLTAIRLILCY